MPFEFRAFLGGALAFLLLLVFMPSYTYAQWVIQQAQSTVSADGRKLDNTVMSLTPLVTARQYKSTLDYGDRPECAPSNICTGTPVCNAPRFELNIALQRIICSVSALASMTVYVTDTLTIPGASSTGSINASTVLQSQGGFTTFSASKHAADMDGGYSTMSSEDYESVGLKYFSTMSVGQRGAIRRLLQHPAQGSYNSDFSGCSQDPSFCTDQETDAQQDSAQSYQTQLNTANLGRVNGALSQEHDALVTFTQFSQQLLTGFQNAQAVNQVSLDQLGGVLNSLSSVQKVQQSIAQAVNASAASQANSVQNFKTVVAGLGQAMSAILAQEAYAALTNAQEQAIIGAAVGKAQSEISVYNFYLANQIQMSQLLTSTISNLRSMVSMIINDPNTARLLTNLVFQAKALYAKRGLFQVTTNDGVPPVTYTNADKYDTILQGAYFTLLPTTLNLTAGGQQASWTVERMSYSLQCDKTYFASAASDMETWAQASTWFGPDVLCAADPVGSCTCRMYVQYQQSRHPQVVSYFLTGQTNASTDARVTQLGDIPLLALVPQYLQSSLNPLSTGSRPHTVSESYFTTLGNVYGPVYEARMMYSLSDIENELQTRMCLQAALSTTQLPSLSSPTFSHAPLGAAPPPGSSGYTFFYRHLPQAQIGDLVPLTSPLTNYLQNNTLSVRPFCASDLATSSQYLSLNVATLFGSLLSAQIRAWKAWLPRLQSVLSYSNGVGPDQVSYTSKDFCWQVNHNGINDTFGRCDTAVAAFCSADGMPVWKAFGRVASIQCWFEPDPRSVSANLLPAKMDMTGSIVWSAPDLERIIPDYFFLAGYPNCMTSPCPVRVTSMVNNTVKASGVGYDTYWYTIPRSLLIESPNPIANIHTPLYMQVPYHRTIPAVLKTLNANFDGNRTRYPAPTMTDFYQMSQGSPFNPTYMDISAHDFQQLLDAIPYDVSAYLPSEDGAQPAQYTVISCRGQERVSTDFEDCDLLNVADMQWDLDSGNGKLYLYPYTWVITTMILPIPAGSPISFPAPTNGCPKNINADRKPLQEAQITVTNSDVNPVGPFFVTTEGCAPFTSNQTILATFQTYTVSVPTCDGETILIKSHSFVNTGEVDTCFQYVVRPDSISVNTVQESVLTLASTTRDPILALSQQNIILNTVANNIIAQNATLLLLNLMNGARSDAEAQQAQSAINALNATFDQIQAQWEQTVFGTDLGLASVQAALQQVKNRVPLLFDVSNSETQLRNELILDQGIYQQVTAEANAQLAIFAALQARVLSITTTFSPYNLYFSSLPSNYNWSNPTSASFITNVFNNGCLALFQPPPAYPAGVDHPCIASPSPAEWVNCLQGQNILYRYILYCLGVLAVLFVLFMIYDLFIKKKNKSKPYDGSYIKRFCQCQPPATFAGAPAA